MRATVRLTLAFAALTALVPLRDAAASSLAEQVLDLNRVIEPDLNIDRLSTAYKALLAEASKALAQAASPGEKVAALNSVLLKDRQIGYLAQNYWQDSTLSAILLRKRANCLAAATLYMLVANDLGLPLCVVPVPHHLYVRWEDKRARINIETTNGGENFADYEYIFRQAQATPDDVEALGWCQAFKHNDFLAMLMEAAGCKRVSENRLAEAETLFKQVEDTLPTRLDLKLAHMEMLAGVKNDRASFKAVAEFSQNKDLPPSVFVDAAMWLASEAAQQRDFQSERKFLLAAFARAPKSSELRILENLAFCHRSLGDLRGAVRYMDLAVALTPPKSAARVERLYELATMEKAGGHLPEALGALRAALEISPEAWNLRLLQAGCECLNGQQEAGLKSFENIQPPAGKVEPYEILLAWFYAVSHQREKFYAQLEKVLARPASPGALAWLQSEKDLNAYRGEPQFKALLEKHQSVAK